MSSFSNKLIIQNGTIYSENQVIKSGFLKIDEGKVSDISLSHFTTNHSDYTIIKIPDTFTVIPGMIDLHIHGANGADTMDATKRHWM